MSSERSERPKHSTDYPKFYMHDTKFDTWKIYFTNKAALSVKAVDNFFSKYGEIIKIDEVPRDFCFVHFKREADAKSCSCEMRNNSTIRLRPFRVPRDSHRKENNTFDKTEDSRQSDKNYRNNRRNDRSNSSVETANEGVKADDNEKTSDTSSASKPSTSYGLYSGSTSASTESIPLDPKGPSEPIGQGNLSISTCGQGPDALPAPLQKMSVGSPPGKAIQPLFPLTYPLMTWARPQPAIIRHITLQDVIVANIPEFCGVEFILDMLEQFRPVCASSIQAIADYSLSYCHVYFETEEQARQVEYLYDNAELCGKNLIVQRPNSMVINADGMS